MDTTDQHIPEKNKRQPNPHTDGFALRWLAVRWTFGFILGWYIVFPMIVGVLLVVGRVFSSIIIGQSSIASFLVILISLAGGGFTAGWVPWRLSLVGRIPQQEWMVTSAIAGVLGFGLLGTVMYIMPPVYTVEFLDNGTHVIYTWSDNFATKELLMSFAFVLGFILPFWFILQRHTQRAWMILPLAAVAASFLAWLRITADMWYGHNSYGISELKRSPMWMPILAFILVVPIISGLLLRFIGWKTPRKRKLPPAE